MWYSKISTGLPEIDKQYANIDELLTGYSKESSTPDKEKWLDKIRNSVTGHLQQEELMFGSRFPKDHKSKHQDIRKRLSLLISSHRDNLISKREFADALRDRLSMHLKIADTNLINLGRVSVSGRCRGRVAHT